MTGSLLLLNGPPSCGKTTLALALQRTLQEPWFHRSLDDFRAGYEDRYWVADDGTLFERVLVGHLGALRQLALAGNNVLAEAVITPQRRQLYASAFEGLQVTFVGVYCPHAEAVRREHQRLNRLRGPIELPEDAFAAVHEGMSYDITVDTTSAGPEVLAMEVASRLSSVDASAFQRLSVEPGL